MNKEPSYNESDLKDHMGVWLWLENKRGEIFMFYHKKFGCWTIPLEKSDPEETLNDAIYRTGKEEIGIAIKNFEIIHTQKDEYIRNGSLVNVQGSLIRVTEYENEPINTEPEKHTDYAWKSKDFIKGLEDSTDAVKSLQNYI